MGQAKHRLEKNWFAGPTVSSPSDSALQPVCWEKNW